MMKIIMQVLASMDFTRGFAIIVTCRNQGQIPCTNFHTFIKGYRRHFGGATVSKRSRGYGVTFSQDGKNPRDEARGK